MTKRESFGTTPRLDEHGLEVPDPTPMEIPVAMRRPETSDERIRRIIAHSLSVRAAEAGLESFEEADDFDIEDDPIDPSTPWEKDFDHAAVAAIDRGVVQAPPPISANAKRILDDYVSRKTSKAPAKQGAPQGAPEATASQGVGAGAPTGEAPPEVKK